MFNKLRNRISRPVYWATIAVIILLSAGIFTPSALSLKNNFIKNARENIAQASNNMEYWFNVIFGGINQLASDTETIETLESEGEKHLCERTKNYMEALRLSQKVLGVYIYEVTPSLSGSLIDYSKNISSPVQYSQLKRNTSVNNFLNGQNDKLISIRSEYISERFAQSRYPAENGIITCMQKVYGTDSGLVGFVAVDISPDIIYGFFKYSSEIYSGSKTYLIDDTGIILYTGTASTDSTAVMNAKKSNDEYMTFRNYYVFDTPVLSSDTVIVHLVRNNAFFGIFWISLIIMLLMDAAVITGAYFVSKRIALKVVTPIEKIKTRMQTEDSGHEL